MDIVLISIAGLSLFLAIAMGVILFGVLREDRRRSDARVAALAVAASRLDPPQEREIVREVPPVVRSSGELFAAAPDTPAWGRRLAVAATFAVVVGALGYVLLPRATGEPAAATANAVPGPVPLELLTLTHTQQPGTLTISGTVYNPRGGATVSQVFAAAVLFGPDGSFLTSARAALDLTALGPGQESPFVITVPVGMPVARYRVGFRSEDGSVIAHVDRRGDGTAAQNAAGGTPWSR